MQWDQAYELATACVTPAEAIQAALPEALGAVLAEPLTALADLPAFDVAAVDGWAVAGPGPWAIRPPRSRDLLASQSYHDDQQSVPLHDGQAAPVTAGDAVGSEVTAVLSASRCVTDAGTLRLAPATGDTNRAVVAGSGIRSRGSDAFAGEALLTAGIRVTGAVLALAALAGHDCLPVIPPPEVLIIRVGDELVDFGVPRGGLGRDAAAPALPAWLTGAGARCHPSRWVTAGDRELIDEIEDTTADVIVTAGPHSGAAVRRVLAGMRAEVLVDGVACQPGESMVLALLADGRPLIHCGAGGPAEALAAIATLAAPLLATRAGRTLAVNQQRIDQTVSASRDHTWLVPVHPTATDSSGLSPILPGGPGGMAAWARASRIAVVPPGGVTRHRRVRILDVP